MRLSLSNPLGETLNFNQINGDDLSSGLVSLPSWDRNVKIKQAVLSPSLVAVGDLTPQKRKLSVKSSYGFETDTEARAKLNEIVTFFDREGDYILSDADNSVQARVELLGIGYSSPKGMTFRQIEVRFSFSLLSGVWEDAVETTTLAFSITPSSTVEMDIGTSLSVYPNIYITRASDLSDIAIVADNGTGLGVSGGMAGTALSIEAKTEYRIAGALSTGGIVSGSPLKLSTGVNTLSTSTSCIVYFSYRRAYAY